MQTLCLSIGICQHWQMDGSEVAGEVSFPGMLSSRGETLWLPFRRPGHCDDVFEGNTADAALKRDGSASSVWEGRLQLSGKRGEQP